MELKKARYCQCVVSLKITGFVIRKDDEHDQYQARKHLLPTVY